MSLMRPDISSSAERRSALGLAVSGSFFDDARRAARALAG